MHMCSITFIEEAFVTSQQFFSSLDFLDIIRVLESIKDVKFTAMRIKSYLFSCS